MQAEADLVEAARKIADEVQAEQAQALIPGNAAQVRGQQEPSAPPKVEKTKKKKDKKDKKKKSLRWSTPETPDLLHLKWPNVIIIIIVLILNLILNLCYYILI